MFGVGKYGSVYEKSELGVVKKRVKRRRKSKSPTYSLQKRILFLLKEGVHLGGALDSTTCPEFVRVIRRDRAIISWGRQVKRIIARQVKTLLQWA